jgi:TonB family protein
MRRFGPAARTIIFLGLVTLPSLPSIAQEQPQPENRKVVNRVPPVYPELARRMQLRGTVKVQVTVSPNGKVSFTEVMGGSPVLASAAVEAIGKWRWASSPRETKELIEINFHPE